VPEGFAAEAAEREGDGPGAEDRWWKSFEDAELDRLVASAFSENLDLRAAYARLAAASAASRVAWAGYVPQVSASGDVQNSRSVFNFGEGGPTGAGGAFDVEQSQVNLQAALSYEVDLWGRVWGQARAGDADLAASESDLATMYITVSANVADTWLQVIEQRATLDLLARQLEVNRTYLELTELRFRQGLASSLDVFQQRQQMQAIEAQIPPARAQLAVLENQLAVLLGKPPGAVEVERRELPEVPPLPEVGLPAELLQNRPDVQAARLRVVAADHRVGAAIANRFPRLTLSASGGFRGFDVAEGLFDNWLYNLVAGLTQPLTDQVRLAAEEARARAQLEEQVASYGRTVLTALREVEDVLARDARQAELVEEIQTQVEIARSTLEEARRRYRNGLSEYLPVLDALEALQSAEQELLAAERQRLSFRVQLCRALGGSWMKDAPAPQENAS
jgi:NodT family efflux transporter outer membrane factor (OMF) lipoprotein